MPVEIDRTEHRTVLLALVLSLDDMVVCYLVDCFVDRLGQVYQVEQLFVVHIAV